MFRRVPAALQAALAVTLLLAGVAPFSDEAYAQGTSDRAHLCQQGGYLTLMRSDFTTFRNTGECVRYAAQGGVFAQAEIHVVAPGPVVNWASLTFVGSGFPHSRPFLVTITSAPGQPTFARTWFSPSF